MLNILTNNSFFEEISAKVASIHREIEDSLHDFNDASTQNLELHKMANSKSEILKIISRMSSLQGQH